MQGSVDHTTPSSSSSRGSTPTRLRRRGRVALTFLGTRGDCQPFVALARGLVARGHEVVVFSNGMHRRFVSDYGIEFVEFQPARVQIGPDKQSMQRLAQQLFANPHMIEDLQAFVKEVREFAPEIILSGTATDTYSMACGLVLKVPVMLLRLQIPERPSRINLLFGLPAFPAHLGWANMLVWRLIYRGTRDWRIDGPDQQAQQALGVSIWSRDGRPISTRAFWDTVMRVPFPYILLGASRLVFEAINGYIPPNLRLTGPWILDVASQTGEASAEQFGGPDVLAKLEAFLIAGSKPVCMGWGSMIAGSPAAMAERACGAAMVAGARVVLVGGWAKLSRELLLRRLAEHRPELRAFVERHVCFVEKAPHEWLFPRCACTVHHGGAGTTAAALRAGVPTIVTPVALDQFDYAAAVQRLGAGLALQKLSKVSEEELGRAIVHACSSEALRKRAAEVGAILRAEDGVASATEEIEKALIMNDLGEYRTFVDCAWERQRELDAAKDELRPTQLVLGLVAARFAVRQLSRGARYLLAPRSAL